MVELTTLSGWASPLMSPEVSETGPYLKSTSAVPRIGAFAGQASSSCDAGVLRWGASSSRATGAPSARPRPELEVQHARPNPVHRHRARRADNK